jgi:hypothetical protein
MITSHVYCCRVLFYYSCFRDTRTGRYRAWQISVIINVFVRLSVSVCRSRNRLDKKTKVPWPLVRKRIMPIERPPRVGEINANSCAKRDITLAAQGIHTDANLCFLYLSRYLFIRVLPQLSSWDWVDDVPHPLLLRKSGSTEKRTLDIYVIRNTDD